MAQWTCHIENPENRVIRFLLPVACYQLPVGAHSGVSVNEQDFQAYLDRRRDRGRRGIHRSGWSYDHTNSSMAAARRRKRGRRPRGDAREERREVDADHRERPWRKEESDRSLSDYLS